jgi:hypothetical protein
LVIRLPLKLRMTKRDFDTPIFGTSFPNRKRFLAKIDVLAG